MILFSGCLPVEQLQTYNLSLFLFCRYTFVPSIRNMQAIYNIEKLGVLMFTNNRTRKAVYHRDINILHQENNECKETKECSVKGIAVLSETRLVLTDAFNYCVRVVSLTENIQLGLLKLSSWPFGITKMREDRIAVTVPVSKEIQILNIDGEGNLSCQKVIHRGLVCCGVVYSRGILFVSYNHPHTKLEMMDTLGNVLKTFSSNTHGQELFKKPYYLAMNRSLDQLCVSDVQINTLTFMDAEIERKTSTFCDKKVIDDVRDIALDSDGVTYVCSFNSDKIYQLLDGGSTIHPLIGPTDGMRGPLSVAYCELTHRLFVGFDTGSVVKAFDINI